MRTKAYLYLCSYIMLVPAHYVSLASWSVFVNMFITRFTCLIGLLMISPILKHGSESMMRIPINKLSYIHQTIKRRPTTRLSCTVVLFIRI